MTIALDQQSLSQALREETANAHEHAEHSNFMTELMEGNLTKEAVADFTAQLWFIYTALEEAATQAAKHELAADIADPRLERREHLENDLATMLGDNWQEQVEALPATQDYVARLQALHTTYDAADAAALTIAHHYVRYLGDVSGGQVISARLAKLYGLPTEALTFYDFAIIGKIPPYRNAYRAKLDALQLDALQREALIAEAKRAFLHNSSVFADLDKRHYISSVTE